MTKKELATKILQIRIDNGETAIEPSKINTKSWINQAIRTLSKDFLINWYNSLTQKYGGK